MSSIAIDAIDPAAWRLRAVRNGQTIGSCRVDAEPISSELTELEFHLTELTLPSAAEARDVGIALLDAAAGLVDPGCVLDARLNAERHDRIAERCELLEAAGFRLFQEKVGLFWADDNRPLPQRNLRYQSLADLGGDAFARVMAATATGSLDRNDRYYQARCGREGWARVFVGFAGAEDSQSWLVGEDDGRPAGFVALSACGEPGVATFTHIGVVPAFRGRGLIDDLVHAGMAAARRRGLRSMLNDVDVENRPMIAALERAGHRATARPWHVWHYRWGAADRFPC